MKRRTAFLIVILGCSLLQAAAQQRLKPAPGVFSALSENYYHALRKSLLGADLPDLSIVVAPSFSKEYALSLHTDYQTSPARHTLTYHNIDGENSLWSSGNFAAQETSDTLSVSSHSYTTILSEPDAMALKSLFKAAIQTMQMPDLDRIYEGCDGTTYYISYGFYTGTCWSPVSGTNCGRLVNLSEQLMRYTQSGKTRFPENLRRKMAKLTRDFKSLRNDFTPDIYVENSWESGDDEEQKTLCLAFSTFQVYTCIPPSVSTEEAYGLLSDYEPALCEIARRIYMLDESPYLIGIDAVTDSEPESAEIRHDADLTMSLIEIKLRLQHLKPDTVMRIYDHLATASRKSGKYRIEKEAFQHLIKETDVQKQNQ